MEKEKGLIINVPDINGEESKEDIQESFKKLSLALGEFSNTINNIFSGFREQISEKLKIITDAIDFSHLSEVQQIHIKNIMLMLQQGWKSGWFLSDYLVIALLDRYDTLTEDYNFDEKYTEKYFLENFDTLIDRAINHSYYKNHKELLLESKRLFKEHSYAISSYPLFSAVDNLFTRWFTNPEQFQLDTNTTYISGEKKRVLKKDKEKYNPTQTQDIAHLTIYSAYEGFLFYFKSCDNRNSLNRNIYMHGNYNYGLMDKRNCLKLWSFLILCIDFIEEMERLKENELKEVIDK